MRHEGYTVILDRQLKDEEAQAVLNAIRMIKHVAEVKPIDGNDLSVDIARIRVRVEIGERLFKVLHEED